MKRIALLVAGLAAVLIALALMTFPANQNADFPGYMEGGLQTGRLAAQAIAAAPPYTQRLSAPMMECCITGRHSFGCRTRCKKCRTGS